MYMQLRYIIVEHPLLLLSLEGTKRKDIVIYTVPNLLFSGGSFGVRDIKKGRR